MLCWAATAWGQRPPDRQVEGFAIHVHHGRATAREELWAGLPTRIQRVRQQLGAHVLSGGEIHVVSDINAFFEWRGLSARAPRWAQAVALPSRRLIVLRLPDPDVASTLTHELSHLAVHEAASGGHVPFWFLEGFAQLQAEQWGVGRTVSIGQAALLGNTIPFSRLDTEFPPHSAAAGLAYSQSFHFVRRLIDRFGSAAVQNWLAGIGRGLPWRESFRHNFGVDSAFEFQDWRESVRVWYGWIPAALSVGTVWTALALLALWARRRVRQRGRVRLAEMEAQERQLYPHDPDDDLF